MDIKFITDDALAAEHFPPLPANKAIPEWYKNLPRYINPGADITSVVMGQTNNRIPQTVKACVPVQDYLTSGYIIRAVADLVVTPTKDDGVNTWGWSSSQPVCDAHLHKQCPIEIKNEKNHYIKVQNAWVVKTPPGYSCYFYQPEFFFNENIKFFPGVVDTDTYPEPVNFSGFLTTKESFIIKAGDPLMVVFPFKRENWTHRLEQAPGPFGSVISRVFERGYKMFFHKQKRYN
jgi:hypothetical protein